MPKQRRPWTKAEQQRETQAIRDKVDLRKYAEALGYVRVGGNDDRVRMQKKSLPGKDPMREIVIKSKEGSITWVSNTGPDSKLGGDVFHLHQHSTGQSFLQARDTLRKFANNKEFEPGVSYEGMSTPEREAKIQARKEEEEIRKEFRRVAAYAEYKKTTAAPNQFLLARGISEQTLAETKSRTDHHGNAVFPHVREDGKFTGYERKKSGWTLYSSSDRGIYVANPSCANPERIKVAEGGLDALSLYQMDTPEQRSRTLYVSSGGNPAEDNALALRGLAERTGVQKIEMVYDRDEAGDEHTANLQKLMAEKSPRLQVEDRRSDYPMREGEDPNDLLRRLQAERQQVVERTQAFSGQAERQQKASDKPHTEEQLMAMSSKTLCIKSRDLLSREGETESADRIDEKLQLNSIDRAVHEAARGLSDLRDKRIEKLKREGKTEIEAVEAFGRTDLGSELTPILAELKARSIGSGGQESEPIQQAEKTQDHYQDRGMSR